MVLKRDNVPRTPPLHCAISDPKYEHLFQTVNAVFGDIDVQGTASQPAVTVYEDYTGLNGTSPLILSFVVPTWVITDLADPTVAKVGLSIRSTPATRMAFVPILGPELSIFETTFEDEQSIQVVPESRLAYDTLKDYASGTAEIAAEIGPLQGMQAQANDQSALATISTLTARIAVEHPRAKKAFAAGATPELSQLSISILQLSLGGQSQRVPCPLPVLGAQYKLRLARKSGYIEVVIPVSIPYSTNEAMKLNPFGICYSGGLSPHPWNIHRVNLAKLPLLQLSPLDPAPKWVNSHAGSSLSVREHAHRKNDDHTDVLACVKDTIHTIFARTAGRAGTRVFALRDDDASGDAADPILCFFVHGLRFDLGAQRSSPTPPPSCSPPRSPRSSRRPSLTSEGESTSARAAQRCARGSSSSPRSRSAAARAGPTVPRRGGGVLPGLCACGRGRDVGAMEAMEAWAPFAPHATRVAISPLFAVSYLELVVTMKSEATREQCARCKKGGAGGAELRQCSRCKAVAYCSEACQKEHWRTHKTSCKAPS
ncbi:uncharacterized protein BXZ73DRAFT_80802 [Epithele typhae]|uniref:uncharacterized protein n=1 Tax=Epithele typhae TaxID=378194 RepID=UPI0020089A68|nr:uncharacterized protein BXZ73DRAFT_80802 [Epithele typhae]KAH9917683.1 hypothetical protein BXZ73DRAFT_80802 [Epithele typhae]